MHGSLALDSLYLSVSHVATHATSSSLLSQLRKFELVVLWHLFVCCLEHWVHQQRDCAALIWRLVCGMHFQDKVGISVGNLGRNSIQQSMARSTRAATGLQVRSHTGQVDMAQPMSLLQECTNQCVWRASLLQDDALCPPLCLVWYDLPMRWVNYVAERSAWRRSSKLHGAHLVGVTTTHIYRPEQYSLRTVAERCHNVAAAHVLKDHVR